MSEYLVAILEATNNQNKEAAMSTAKTMETNWERRFFFLIEIYDLAKNFYHSIIRSLKYGLLLDNKTQMILFRKILYARSKINLGTLEY